MMFSTRTCSTPFGVTDFCTTAPGRLSTVRRQDVMCSTPFGVTDFCTWRSGRRVRRWSWCAQRLSASLTSAHNGGSIGSLSRDKCSTPFGVTDFCTSPVSSAASIRGACSTPFGVTDFCTGIRWGISRGFHCAQRLSASLTSARGEFTFTRHTDLGAQRLSASLTSAHSAAPLRGVRFAFRCSTPFGVTDFCTGSACSRGIAGLVLNAFRRH